MTTTATITINSSSLEPMSSMDEPGYQETGSAVLLLFLGHDRRIARRLPLNAVNRARGILDIIVGHALLERLDALGDISHQRGNPAAAEQQHDHEQNQHPMYKRKRTHFTCLLGT